MTKPGLIALLLLLGLGGAWGTFASLTERSSRDAAAAMTGGDPDRGRQSLRSYGCSACHTIPGIPGAFATVGPPLTQMGNRGYIAGVLQNTPGNLVQWIQNPRGIDAKTAMPQLHVSETDARDMASYLYTLK
jgi:cytochrome c